MALREVEPVIGQLRHTADAESFAVIAYCFMPDHLHVLAEGRDAISDFRQFVRLFKQRSSFEWKRRTGSQLWQRSYFERVLRADDDVMIVARYLLANPIRGGLAKSPKEYPFLGSFTMNITDLLESLQR